MKWFITGLFCWLALNLAYSQNNEVLKERLQAEQVITLLKNENFILPLRRLDTLRTAVLYIGDDPGVPFIKSLKRYATMSFHRIRPGFSSAQMVKSTARQIADKNLLIIAYASSQIDNLIWDFLRSVTKGRKAIHVNFNDGKFLDTQSWLLERAALIHADGNDALSQDYTGQLIFGGIGARGTLEKAVSPKFPKGYGLITFPTRLKYTIPEELGISSDTLYRRVDELVEGGLSAGAYPGAQVMAVKDGKVFFHRQYGFHTFDSLRAVQDNDIYDLASVTKVTAATLALMKLHDAGLFQLDVPAATYWEPFKRGNKKDLTFRAILAHDARLKSWIPYWTTTTKKNGKYKPKTLSRDSSEAFPIKLGNQVYMHKDYRQKIYKMISRTPLNAEAGYVYSGLSFYLYPQIVENLSGLSFPQFLDETYYAPLGAHETLFRAGEEFPLARIIPTEKDTFFRMKQLHGVVHDEGAAMMQGVSGNAGLFSTADDLAKIWQMLLNGGSYGGQRYLSQQTIEKFTNCQFCETGNRRGLGFDKPLIEYHPVKSSVSPLASFRSYGHSGYTGTFVWADPENDFLFIFLSNRVYPTRNNRKIYQMNIRPDIHDVFYQLLK